MTAQSYPQRAAGGLVATIFRCTFGLGLWVARYLFTLTAIAIRWSIRAVAWRLALIHEGRRLRRAHALRAARRAQLLTWVAAAAPIDTKGVRHRGTV